jgi:hypothetical protein
MGYDSTHVSGVFLEECDGVPTQQLVLLLQLAQLFEDVDGQISTALELVPKEPVFLQGVAVVSGGGVQLGLSQDGILSLQCLDIP